MLKHILPGRIPYFIAQFLLKSSIHQLDTAVNKCVHSSGSRRNGANIRTAPASHIPRADVHAFGACWKPKMTY